MLNSAQIQEEYFVYKKRRRRRLQKNITLKNKRRLMLSLTVSFGLIIIASFFMTRDIYISSNSKDLGFSVEHNFTSGFSSENKLLRVQKMSLLYNDGETAVVEASGLSKAAPHKTISIKGSFKKDNKKSWCLEKIFDE